MTNLSWQIGDIEIFQIVELEAGKIIQEAIKDATPDALSKIDWLYPNFVNEKGELKALVQSFLIRTKDKNIIIDTCNGNDRKRIDIPEWSDLNTNFLKNLETIGLSRDQIDIVACTHLHMDHIGWNTLFQDGQWIPTFPKAKYLFAKKEYEYWLQKPINELNDDNQAFNESILPIINAGLAELVEENYQIDTNIRFIPTPGHTPCHVSILIESKGESAIISGDIMHHPCQITNPHWGDADYAKKIAIKTRKKVLNDCKDKEILFIGSHFSSPVAGKIVENKGELKLQVP